MQLDPASTPDPIHDVVILKRRNCPVQALIQANVNEWIRIWMITRGLWLICWYMFIHVHSCSSQGKWDQRLPWGYLQSIQGDECGFGWWRRIGRRGFGCQQWCQRWRERCQRWRHHGGCAVGRGWCAAAKRPAGGFGGMGKKLVTPNYTSYIKIDHKP